MAVGCSCGFRGLYFSPTVAQSDTTPTRSQPGATEGGPHASHPASANPSPADVEVWERCVGSEWVRGVGVEFAGCGAQGYNVLLLRVLALSFSRLGNLRFHDSCLTEVCLRTCFRTFLLLTPMPLLPQRRLKIMHPKASALKSGSSEHGFAGKGTKAQRLKANKRG